LLNLLKGIRVLDLSTIVLGPYATQLLGDFGADVIKVEPPAGDAFRSAGASREGHVGAGFLNLNRNKRSIVLDLADPADADVLRRLVASSDVVVHNIRPRSARKLNIDWESLRAVRPDLVYCSARGFAEGPLGDEPAYDDVIQASSGLAWMNADGAGEPRFFPSVVCDKVTGLHLAFSISAGLAARERTGEGVCIEVPMYETMVSFLMPEQLGGMTFDPPVGPMGYERLTSPNRRPYRTTDGFIAVMPYTTAHWQRYLAIIGRHDLVADPLVTEPARRAAGIDKLYGIVAAASRSRSTGAWIEELRAADIPCAPVLRMEDLPADPQLIASETFQPMHHPAEGNLKSIRSPFRIRSDEQEMPDRPAPILGAHGTEILAELGLVPENRAERQP
jgi:crotonobetainyl-CoA:carnitine CoA-transferase CaiB-like acyl-CoA transferase